MTSNLLRSRSKFFTAALLLSLLTPWTAANAGVFSVSPVRLYMSPRDRAIAVTLTNEGDTAVSLQADINSWSQTPDGTEELVLTDDLILSPPIIKLLPKTRQVVRLARLKPADASRQLTYRLIIREIPEAVPSSGLQVPIVLAFSLPVFITPALAKYQIACTTSAANNAVDGAVNSVVNSAAFGVVCSNTGTAYTQVREAVLLRGEQSLAKFDGGSYILPGSSKSFSLKSDKALTAGQAQLVVTFDDGKKLSTAVVLP
jgi:fimbrial chaperone protein